MKKLLAFSSIILIVISSCKKSNTQTCSKTMNDIAGTYSIIKLEVGIGGVFTDRTSSIDPCERDDNIILGAGGDYTVRDAGCINNGDQTGVWTIRPDGKLITTLNGSITPASESEIVSFDCSTLVLLETDDSGGTITQIRSTIKK